MLIEEVLIFMETQPSFGNSVEFLKSSKGRKIKVENLIFDLIFQNFTS